MAASDYITVYIAFVDDAFVQHRICTEEYEKSNRVRNDILHAIEFNTDGYAQRNKLASKLEACSRDRRFYKDRVQELDQIIKYLEIPENKKAFNLLKNTLGEMRKAESFHKDRVYWPRSADPALREFFWKRKQKICP